MIQLDSGVLTRMAQKDHRDHTTAVACVLNLHSRNESLIIIPQNIHEFWTVATRPKTSAEGLGLTPEQTKTQIDRFLAMFPLEFNDDRQLYAEWMRLVETHRCLGKAAHDARLVAAMNLHGITRMLTFNAKDFRRYAPAIYLLEPAQIVAQPPQA